MNLRAPVPIHAAVVFAHLVHAGAGRDAQPLDRLARVKRAVDVHQQHVAIGDGEAISTCHAGRIQQAINHQRVGVGGGLLQVVGDEVRKLLRPAHAGVDGQATRRLPVLAFLANGAEVAGAQEGREIALGIPAGVQAEAGKTEVGRQLAAMHAALAVVERRRVIGQFMCLAIDHVEHAHRRMEIQAQVEEPGLEFPRLVGPQRVILAVADGLVLVPVQLLQLTGQGAFMALVRRGSQRARLALERGEVERLRLADTAQALLGRRGGTGSEGRQAEGGQGGGSVAQEVASLHRGGLLETVCMVGAVTLINSVDVRVA